MRIQQLILLLFISMTLVLFNALEVKAQPVSTLLMTLNSPNPQSESSFGEYIVGLGDVNNDLVPDIAVSSAYQDVNANIDQGQVYILSGADGSLIRILNDPNPQAAGDFGSDLAVVGDINNDNVMDIVIGSGGKDIVVGPLIHVNQGQAYVFSGKDGSLLLTLDDPLQEANTWFGVTLAGVGDVNNDLTPDIAAGALFRTVGGNVLQGQAYVLSGIDGTLIYTLNDPNPQGMGWFGGYSLSGVGDVDGDNVPDISVGAVVKTVNGNIGQGQAFIFSGVNGAPLYTLDNPSPQVNSQFSFGTLAKIGDLDGDLIPDLAVGAYWQNVGGNISQGQAFIFSGADGALLFTLNDPNPQPNGVFGWDLAGIGDVNCDSVPDLAVGAPHKNVGGKSKQGQVFIFSGKDGMWLHTIDDPTPQVDARFGAEIKGIGDFNGDSVQELAVGAYHQDVGGNLNQGQMFVFSVLLDNNNDGISDCSNKATSYTIIDLGSLTINGIDQLWSEGYGINSSGEVVGFSGDAFLYSAGTMLDLGTLGGSQSYAYGINDSGQVAGSSQIALSSATQHAFRFSNGMMLDLGTLGGASSFALAINASGEVAGTSHTASGGNEAFLYSGGTMQGIGTLGGVWSNGFAINDSGQVAGSSLLPNANSHAFRYSNGMMQDLGTLGGGSSYALAINNSGEVTGTSYAVTGDQHLFLYSGGTMHDLGTLNGSYLTRGHGINDLGEIVGQSWMGPQLFHAFLYSGGTIKDLNDLLPAESGWMLEHASGINDLGQISGYGMHKGLRHAYLMSPDNLNTPPVADAGPDQPVILIDTTVTLDGSQSYDDDGDLIDFSWTITQKPTGSNAELIAADRSMPTFVTDEYGDYVAVLVVSDALSSSDPDTVLVSLDNVPPVADAGGNQGVIIWNNVLLDGTGSSDANGDMLTYSWNLRSKPLGSNAVLSGPNNPTALFVADVAGTYEADLIVNDGLLDSLVDTATIVAVTVQTRTTTVLQNTIIVVETIPLTSLKNNEMVDKFTKKITEAMGKIDTGEYKDAINIIEEKVLFKSDGCANTGVPDGDDWITDCSSQALVYQQAMEAINLLRSLL